MLIDCTINDVGDKGDGIAHYQNKTVFIPFTAIGDKVKAKIISENNNIIRAEIIEIIEPSPDRKIPVCKHFGKCGGCTLQHLKNDKYIEFKWNTVLKIKKNLNCHNLQINPLFEVGEQSRRRATFKVSVCKKQVHLGFFAYRTNNVVDIEECLILEDEIFNIVPKLKECLVSLSKSSNITASDISLLKNGLDIIFSVRKPMAKKDEEKLISFAKENNIARLSIKLEEKSNIKSLYGKSGIISFGGVDVEFPAGSFLQASEKAEKAIANLILKYTKDNTKICELFCGCGTYSLPLAKQTKKISAYEFDEEMIISLFNVARNAGLENLLTVHKRDLFKKPLKPEELNGFDCIVINPPRAGAKEQTKQIAKSSVKKVIMVSCNPFTFERDAKELIDNGFDLLEITPIDQFYYTSHLELVGLFQRLHS